MVSKTADITLAEMRERLHPACPVCSEGNGHGLVVRFEVEDDGVVVGRFDRGRVHEGYAGMLHGGVISSLLDGAMTNCLFARGCSAVTVELRVRFRHPVESGRPATVRAWVSSSSPPLYVLEGQIVQDGRVKSAATGKFLDRPELAGAGQAP